MLIGSRLLLSRRFMGRFCRANDFAMKLTFPQAHGKCLTFVARIQKMDVGPQIEI
jgi:hypothetical protein